jgi:hypothetical protein
VGAARGVGRPLYGSSGAARALPVSSSAEDSPSGLWRSPGTRVGGNPSWVQIPYPPPMTHHVGCCSNERCTRRPAPLGCFVSRPRPFTTGLRAARGERKTYRPIIRQEATGSRTVTWAEFVEAGLLRQYQRQHRVLWSTLRRRPETATPGTDGRGPHPRLCPGRRSQRSVHSFACGARVFERVTWDGDVAVRWRPDGNADSPGRRTTVDKLGSSHIVRQYCRRGQVRVARDVAGRMCVTPVIHIQTCSSRVTPGGSITAEARTFSNPVRLGAPTPGVRAAR